MEPFSANLALQLLWILEKENDKYELELTKEEQQHLRMCLLEDWSELTTPYKKQLVTMDKLDTISLMSKGESIFK